MVYYEYQIKKQFPKNNFQVYKKFVHADLYNIEDPEEFKQLGLEEFLKSGVIMVIEWGEKLADIYNAFKAKAHIVHVNINYYGKLNRTILISEII